MNPQKKLLSLLLVLSLMLFIGGRAANAANVVNNAERQVAMDQEMDCIAQHFESNGDVPWQSNCSSQFATGSYDVAKAEKPYKYYGAENQKMSANLDSEYDYPRVAAVSNHNLSDP